MGRVGAGHGAVGRGIAMGEARRWAGHGRVGGAGWSRVGLGGAGRMRWAVLARQGGAGRAAGLTCRILQRSDRQSMSSHGWYIPSVTQFSRITSMLTHSNHVHSESRTKQCGRRPWARGAECTPECNNPHHKHRRTPHSWFFPSSGSFPEWVIARVLRQRPLYSRHGHTCQTHLRTPSSLSHHRQSPPPPPTTHTHLLASA